MTPLALRHQQVQRLRRLLTRRSRRDAERAFVLEGAKVIGEALAAGRPIEVLFVAPGADDPLVDRVLAAGGRVRLLGPGVLERLGGTVTPQPFLAVAPYCDVPLASVRDAGALFVCVDVRDPGNAGTVLRSAGAAGMGGVVFCAGSVDVFNPKAVRASAGALFHVPVVRGGDVAEVLEQLGDWEFARIGAVAQGGTSYDEADLRGRVAIVLGNEAHGLEPAIEARLDSTLTIPMVGPVESLNVGMAAAVLGFEVVRQRRRASAP